MGSVAKAVHEVKVSWEKSSTNLGWFILSSSLLSGSDVLAPASQLIPAFSGTYDDVSSLLVQASWSRGRSSTLDQVEAGKWSAVIRDPDGRFNPSNPASPLYGSSNQSGRPFRHRAKLTGTWYPQFYGWTRSVEYEPRSRGRGFLHIEGDDLFVKLDVLAPTIAALGATTTGGVIGACLDAIGFTDPVYRSVATGDTIPNWPGISDASETLLALIAQVLQTEFGLFFANATGVATFENRLARTTRAVTYVISDEMKTIAPGAGLDNIANRATYTKTGSTAQTYTDAASADPVFGLGLRALPEVTSAYLVNDEAALARAQYRVNIRKDPTGDVWSLKIDNRTVALLQMILDLDFCDRVQSDEANTGTSFDGFVERVQRSVSAKPYRDSADYMLSARGKSTFLLSSSLLSGSDVLAL